MASGKTNNVNGLSLSHKAKKDSKTNWIYQTYVLPNPKTREAHHVEASIEHDFVLKCFFDPDILAIKTQINSINSESQGRRYTPDSFVMRKTGALMSITKIKSR